MDRRPGALLAPLARLVPPSRRTVPVAVRWLSVPVVAGVVVLGMWVAGAVLTDDFALAQVLTAVFLAAALLAALAVSLRWRALALPVLLTFAVVGGGVGGFLALRSNVDTTVDEMVAMADVGTVTTAPAVTGAPTATASAAASDPVKAVAVGRGTFESRAHETRGVATLIRLPEGRHVVTLTDFVTDPGPDVRVYLTPGDGDSVKGSLDLGALKGNRGNQQYAVPAGTDVGRYGAVVVWCRAFTVAFGVATLG